MNEKPRRRLCYHCSRVIFPGAPAYRLRGELFADWDGVLAAPEDRETSPALESALAEADGLEAEVLEAQVHRALDLCFCPACHALLEREWLEDGRVDRAARSLH